MSLSGKVALVTGASRGLGKAIALALGKAGADVVVTDLLLEGEEGIKEELFEYSPLAGHFAGTDAVQTKATAEAIKDMGSKSLAMKMDVTDVRDIKNVITTAEKEFGSIDILINNAGVMDNFGILKHQAPDRWERDLKVNLTGAFNCIKEVWPGMMNKKWGRIINISSIAGVTGAFAQPGYGASKAGLIGLTKSMAIEGGKHGITVNAICPGLIETEATILHNKEVLERMKKTTALGRFGKPEEVALVVAFYASEASSYITGAIVPITGGCDLFIF